MTAMFFDLEPLKLVDFFKSLLLELQSFDFKKEEINNETYYLQCVTYINYERVLFFISINTQKENKTGLTKVGFVRLFGDSIYFHHMCDDLIMHIKQKKPNVVLSEYCKLSKPPELPELSVTPTEEHVVPFIQMIQSPYLDVQYEGLKLLGPFIEDHYAVLKETKYDILFLLLSILFKYKLQKQYDQQHEDVIRCSVSILKHFARDCSDFFKVQGVQETLKTIYDTTDCLKIKREINFVLVV